MLKWLKVVLLLLANLTDGLSQCNKKGSFGLSKVIQISFNLPPFGFVPLVTAGLSLYPCAAWLCPSFSFAFSLSDSQCASYPQSWCWCLRSLVPVISGGAITREMTVLFFSLSCSPSRCPLFSSFSSSRFPCAVPLHAPLSCRAANITKMAFAQHEHTHAYTHKTVNILAWLGKCICAI